jgi:hypothetical protein
VSERAIIISSQDTFRVVREAPFESEASLHSAIASNPEVLPARDVGLDTLVPIGTEVRAGDGFIDLLAADRQGRLVIVEFKKGPENPDVRRVVAQLLDYGSSLWQTTFEELQHLCDSASLVAQTAEAHDRLQLDFDADVFESGVRGNLETGDFVYFYVARVLDLRTRRILTYLGDAVRLAFIAIEADHFRDETAFVIVPRPAFVPAWMATSGATRTRPTRPASRVPWADAASEPAREAAALLELLVRERGWEYVDKNTRTYWKGDGPRVYLYPNGLLEFRLESYARATSDESASVLLDRMQAVAGRQLTAKWPNLPAERVLTDWQTVRDAILIPFVEVIRVPPEAG